jgi:predicted PurR-regulated permease PerM
MNDLPPPAAPQLPDTTVPAAVDGALESPLLEAPTPAPDRLPMQMPVDVRSVSLSLLALIATLFALHVASAIFIPLLLGLVLSYALSPLVDRLERWHLPRALGAGLLILGLGAVVGWTVATLSDDATVLIESLPAATQKLRKAVQAQRGQTESTIDKVQRAAAEIEEVAKEGTATRPAPARGVTRVSIERERFDIQDYLWSGTLGAAASAGQAVVVVFIAFFLLASGSRFRRKMVKLAGPTFAQKRITVQVLDEITAQIHRFMLVQVFVSVLVGLVTGLAFYAVGLEYAAVWGVVAFVLNFVPYLGTVALTAGSGLMAFVQFGSLNMVLLVAGIGMLIHAVSGNLLTPWLTSRTSRMNALTVFVGVLAFGWLWGVWGLLLGVPILTTVKAICDRVDELKSIGELMGT